ncbi:MAG: N-formylglutamate deformylase [Robiginitomaculum sp.]|nr:MAG: N-formylglutamate deformylase [Robiginitomaculum sp.]
MENDTYTFVSGTSPLLVSMPHIGTNVPKDISSSFTKHAVPLPDTDWHVDKLYNFLGALGANRIQANLSRYVIDLNRPSDGAPLYPGQSETQLCPLKIFTEENIYLTGQEPSQMDIAKRTTSYWAPYHQKLRQELNRIKEEFGYALLWDAHSITSIVPKFFEGKLPDLNIGTANNTTCPKNISEKILSIGTQSDYSTVSNGRFKGGYITRNYGDPDNQIYAVQMETALSAYMDDGAPYAFNEVKADKLRPVLQEMMQIFQSNFS